MKARGDVEERDIPASLLFSSMCEYGSEHNITTQQSQPLPIPHSQEKQTSSVYVVTPPHG